MTTGNEEILNTGLSLAMEFGADWLKPIQDRLSVKYPTLTQMERVWYNTICREAMEKGHTSLVRKS
jgi:hypothetical protein